MVRPGVQAKTDWSNTGPEDAGPRGEERTGQEHNRLRERGEERRGEVSNFYSQKRRLVDEPIHILCL